MSSLTASANGPTDWLSFASSVIRSYTGVTFTLTTDAVVELDPRPDGTASLPEVPVSAVSSVVGRHYVNGQVISRPITAFGFARRGVIFSTASKSDPDWPTRPGSLTVTYTFGFETIPDEIVDLTTVMAEEYGANPRALTNYRVGEKSESWSQNNGKAPIKDSWKAILDRYSLLEVA